MPIVKISGKIVYFAHVPKCAGTAIEMYLINAFGPLAFHNPRFRAQPVRKRWLRSSPQHVDANTLSTLFPDTFFDAYFSVVRSPTTRLVSAFRFQRDIEGSMPADMSLGDWLTIVHKNRRRTPWQFDNHTRPMDEIVPRTATVFKLETGLDPMIAWLQDLAGPDHTLPQQIPDRNVLDKRLVFEGKHIRPVVPSMDEIALIAEYYAVDFTRFGYDPATGAPVQSPTESS